MSQRLSFAIVCALAAACAVPASALSASPTEGAARSVRVVSSDLNLNSDFGAQVFLRRIETAASKVCAPEPERIELARHRAYQTCVSTAVREAVAKAANPRLTSLYEGRPATLASNR